MTDHLLTVENLTKIFNTDKGDILAVDAVNFEISSDEFFTMLGPSGCGKTTTLRMIAGLENVTDGRVLFDGKDFGRFSHLERNIGMVFQSYALFPHMTVFENAAYGLRLRPVEKSGVKTRVERTLDFLGLQQLADRHPADLSGGQQQRVAIARALVYDPIMLLLDEPLANLDAKLRVEMREEIRRVQKELGIMAVYVTHDQEEAMAVSDRVAVFNQGQLMQVGPPTEIYADPESLFVADFVGKANFFKAGNVESIEGQVRVILPSAMELIIDRVRSIDSDLPSLQDHLGEDLVMVRPEHVIIEAADSSATAAAGIPGRVKRIQFLGNMFSYLVSTDHAIAEVTIDGPRAVSGLSEGDTVNLKLNAADAILFRAADTA